MNDNSCYWRLYKSTHGQEKGLFTVVEMQWFDEGDYHDENFIRDETGERYKFDDEQVAITFLNEHVPPDLIVEEYRRSDKNFMVIKRPINPE